MSWYRRSLVIDDDIYSKMKYRTEFSRLLSHIHILEKTQINILSRVYTNTINSNNPIGSEYNFDALIERSKLIEKQEVYAVEFTVVVYKLYAYDHVAKIEKIFNVILLGESGYRIVDGYHQHSLSRLTCRVKILIVELGQSRNQRQTIDIDIRIARI